jgi:hypothetical protein
MNYPCRVLLTKNILKESTMSVAWGLIFDSLLSVIAGSRFFDILSTNNLKILQNLESLLGMSIETTVG